VVVGVVGRRKRRVGRRRRRRRGRGCEVERFRRRPREKKRKRKSRRRSSFVSLSLFQSRFSSFYEMHSLFPLAQLDAPQNALYADASKFEIATLFQSKRPVSKFIEKKKTYPLANRPGRLVRGKDAAPCPDKLGRVLDQLCRVLGGHGIAGEVHRCFEVKGKGGEREERRGRKATGYRK
jgi:hypothetical protein